jgi:hypothetical protein
LVGRLRLAWWENKTPTTRLLAARLRRPAPELVPRQETFALNTVRTWTGQICQDGPHVS